jgi:prevent-host-death family protein
MAMEHKSRVGGMLRDRGRVKYAARTVVSATEAAKTLAVLLDRVRARSEEIVIERHGKPIARLVPIDEPGVCTASRFVEALRALPPLDAEYRAAVRSGIDEMNQPVPIDGVWES